METLSKWLAAHEEPDVVPLWSSYADEVRPYVTVSREFAPAHFGLGFDVNREYASASRPDALTASVQVGPFALTLRWEWNRPARCRPAGRQ